MSSDDGESRPILIEDTHSLQVERTSRRRRYCMILLTVCLSVSVCLAIVLPVTLSQQQASSEEKVPQPLLLFNGRPSLNVRTFPRDVSTEETIDEDTTDHTRHHFWTTRTPRHRPTWRTTTVPMSTTTHAPFYNCPTIDKSKRSPVDLESLEGQTLYEIVRVQSLLSPDFIVNPSCLVVRPQKQSAGNWRVNVTWQNGGHRHRRHYNNATFDLKKTNEDEWITTMVYPNASKYHGKLTVLAQLGTYLLTYTCYSEARLGESWGERRREWKRPPSYTLAVLTAAGGEWFDYRLADALLAYAYKDGLNPGHYDPVYLPHTRCARDDDEDDY